MTNKSEYSEFSNLLKKVISVPHEEVKKALEAEKAKKKSKPKVKRQP
jgi:hypothetical protein